MTRKSKRGIKREIESLRDSHDGKRTEQVVRRDRAEREGWPVVRAATGSDAPEARAAGRQGVDPTFIDSSAEPPGPDRSEIQHGDYVVALVPPMGLIEPAFAPAGAGVTE